MSDIAAPPAPAGGTPATPNTPAKTPVAPAAPVAKVRDPVLPGPNSKLAEPKTPPAGEPTPAEKKEIERKKYQFKVHGEDIEEDLSEEEVKVRLQKEHASRKVWNESAQIKKAAQQLIEDLRRDPWAVLQDPAFGVNLEELAEQRLAEKYKAELMTEEQRKAYELEKQVKQYQEQDERRKQQAKSERQKQMEAQVYAQEEKRFLTAAEKHGLSKDMHTLAAMAEVALLNHEYGIELNEDQLAMEVLAREEKPLARIKALKGDALLNKLGPDVVNEILRAKVAEFKSKQINPQPPAPKQERSLNDEPERPERKLNSLRDWRKSMREG